MGPGCDQPADHHDGEGALELIKSAGPYAVIVSDMRMPGMDGAAFLAKARECFPEVVRMLLTGQSDMQSAISAVNFMCWHCLHCSDRWS